MAERRTRRSFTREFKAQAVKRLLDGGKGLSEVATELGIGTGQLSQWRTEHLAAGSAEALAVRKAEGSPCVQPHDALISPLYSTGGSPPLRATQQIRVGGLGQLSRAWAVTTGSGAIPETAP